jgi:Na+/H+-dicarboxylate symporter
VEIFPQNIIGAAGSNRNMLQVVFFALFIGVGLILVRNERTEVVLRFFQGLNDVIIKLVDVIMLVAPIGVFALIADTITSIAGDSLASVLELLRSLGFYALVVFLGLLLHVIFVYGGLVRFISPLTLRWRTGSLYKPTDPKAFLRGDFTGAATGFFNELQCGHVAGNDGMRRREPGREK